MDNKSNPIIVNAEILSEIADRIQNLQAKSNQRLTQSQILDAIAAEVCGDHENFDALKSSEEWRQDLAEESWEEAFPDRDFPEDRKAGADEYFEKMEDDGIEWFEVKGSMLPQESKGIEEASEDIADPEISDEPPSPKF